MFSYSYISYNLPTYNTIMLLCVQVRSITFILLEDNFIKVVNNYVSTHCFVCGKNAVDVRGFMTPLVSHPGYATAAVLQCMYIYMITN